ncbi:MULTISPECIES: F0F1 ATP synthase subunit gamma [Cyanophyceae]|uniref:F0F1 ATP synthase subunit gamma n=1 Tax=Cyanophyceae TaxID=3028117 RepID=UPI00016DC4EC|nr:MULTISPECIES: F0F1 ATP synthase subunit gamma [Cyanophyceae]ACB01192.1 ATP synthase F1, gamma subunit [Picosynechococcus sp. PCC 7002]SMH48026.1 F-type H+-transporting ATPase subunit gamma [Picosynechococcus sp. OG1]SMQ81155.1 F-type H+-transporting ATPase subunit gamma [Synechococcus sp. 7002]
MHTLESLRNTINSIEDLRAVVRTMKALAMVSIRQYEQARTALQDYNHSLDLGFQALLQHRRFAETDLDQPLPLVSNAQQGKVGLILFGSNHGLCGQFNEQLATYALQACQQRHLTTADYALATVGDRLLPYLQSLNHPHHTTFRLPNSLAGTPRLIQNLLALIDQWYFEAETSPVRQILLIYHQSQSKTLYQPVTRQLLPLDRQWLREMGDRPWQSTAFPLLNGPWAPTFSGVVRQYLFLSLYRAAVESLASENAARLASMQAAEKNIEERLGDLQANYRQQRQNSITEELLDIVSGFEALNPNRTR